MKMPPRSIFEDEGRNNIDKRSCLGGGATKRAAGEEPEEDLSGLPEHLDWRKHHPPVVTPVKNQGQCGSCWTFSTTETLESAWALAGYGLIELAPQQIVDCSP